MTKHDTALIEAKEDLYYGVHKGIRLAHARLLILLGQTDPASPKALSRALAALEAHLDLGFHHLSHENAAIHTALEARVPGGPDHAADDHDGHLATFAELRGLMAEARSARGDLGKVWRRLYQRFALFVADDLVHMHEEETELQPTIENHFSAAEITGIREQIVGGIPPQEMVGWMRLILGAANPAERREIVGGLQAGMPAPVFSETMEAVIGMPWRADDWTMLERAVC